MKKIYICPQLQIHTLIAQNRYGLGTGSGDTDEMNARGNVWTDDQSSDDDDAVWGSQW